MTCVFRYVEEGVEMINELAEEADALGEEGREGEEQLEIGDEPTQVAKSRESTPVVEPKVSSNILITDMDQ